MHSGCRKMAGFALVRFKFIAVRGVGKLPRHRGIWAGTDWPTGRGWFVLRPDSIETCRDLAMTRINV